MVGPLPRRTNGRRHVSSELCRRCGTPLAEGAAFCAKCGLARPERYVGAMPTTSRPGWLLPAGIVGVGIAAIALGAVLGLVVMGPREAAQSSAAPSGAASGSPALSSSASPTTERSPTPVAMPVHRNLAIVEVTVDTLLLRPTTNEAAEPAGALGAGARLFIIGAPEEDGDLRWYRVAVSAGPYTSDGCPDPSTCMAIGWVGGPATGEEMWLSEVTVDCPASPTTVEELGALAPLERLNCYGNGEITATGTIDHPPSSDAGPIRYTPEWLADPATPAIFTTGGMLYRTSPEAELEVPERGAVIRFTGHFEDPAATDCRASVDPDATEPVELPSQAQVVLRCRTELVITEYEVIGP